MTAKIRMFEIIPVEQGIEWVSYFLSALLNCSINTVALSIGSALSIKRVGDFPGSRPGKALMVLNLRLQVGGRASDLWYFPLPNPGAALLGVGDLQEAASCLPGFYITENQYKHSLYLVRLPLVKSTQVPLLSLFRLILRLIRTLQHRMLFRCETKHPPCSCSLH